MKLSIFLIKTITLEIMQRFRRSAHTLLTLYLFSMGIPSFSQEKQPDALPNILLILVDDLGYGDLAIQGATDMQTPHLDELAQSGMNFTNFYANSTVCSPSRASLLTGRYPDMVGVPGVIRQFEKENWGYLVPNAVLIPETLKTKGYQTGMIGKWHLGLESPNTPTEKGFDFFKGFLADMMDDYYTHLRAGVNWMRHNDQEISPKGHATDIFTDWTLDYLKAQKNTGNPFFLYLAYNAPHFPIQPPTTYLEVVKRREKDITEERAKNVALIEHLDFNIGRIVQYLEGSGLSENTLIIFSSDNGGSLPHAQDNGKLRGGKQDMYEGGLKVPTYFVWKNKIEAGSQSGNFAMLMDIYPTLCGLLGIENTLPVDGSSFAPVLLGQEKGTEDRMVFWVRREGGKYGGKAYYAVRYQGYKLLQNTPYEPLQLFNIAQDPYETQVLEPKKEIVYDALFEEMKTHIRNAGAVPWQKSKDIK